MKLGRKSVHQIDASKRHARLSGAMVLSVGLLLSAGAVGAAFASAAPDAAGGAEVSGFLKSSEMPEAWASAIKTFPETLPKGVAWPESTPASLSRAGELNEVGMSELTIAFYWACAWESAYLDGTARGDKSAQENALKALGTFKELPIIQTNFPDERIWFKHVVEPALSGDASGIKYDFETGCGLFAETNGK